MDMREMTGIKTTLIAIIAMYATAMLHAEEIGKEMKSNLQSVEDVKVMRDESVVFCKDLQPHAANLLFAPTKIITVQRANRSQVYKEGVDFILKGRTLTLTKGSRIPVLKYFSEARDDSVYRFKEPDGFIYSPGGVTKHNDYDIEVTYEYRKGNYADLFRGCARSDALTVCKKLAASKPVTICFFGDSITVGAQASGALPVKAKPQRDGYPRLVFNALQKKYPDADMKYFNKAVGGKETTWGLSNMPAIVDTNPDLLVLAFGMNDGSKSSKAYLQNTREMVATVRKKNPDVSILLVAEFSPNPNLGLAKYILRKENRDGLFAMQKELKNCAVVDVGVVSRAMVERKKFCDLSGNNVNHPNDFLHQVYADAAFRALVLGERQKRATSN